jgi:hypothetical protein
MKTSGLEPCVRHPVTVMSELAFAVADCGGVALLWAAMSADAAITLTNTPIN